MTKIRIFAAAIACGAFAFVFIGPPENDEPVVAVSGYGVIKVDDTPLDRTNRTVVTSYADVLEHVRPAVVSVYSTKTVRGSRQPFPFDDPFFERFFGRPGPERERQQEGLGSGVIVSEDGYILTNNHVVEGADEIRVQLDDQREFTATLVGADPQTDVAVLKIEANDLNTATLSDSEQIRVGDIVFALGNPLRVGQTVTMGIISATGRSQIGILGRDGYENFIQTDAAINQGNSGGPLVDAYGRVIGINTAILSRTGGNIGIGFAIPVNLAASVMESLIETGTVARGFLGVEIQELDQDLADEFGVDDVRGVLIAGVRSGSPAEEAGLQPGDVITRVAGKRVTSITDVRLQIAQMGPGRETSITVIRGGEEQTVNVKLGRLDREVAEASNELLPGINVTPVNREHREEFGLPDEMEGLVVTEVSEGSRYARSFPPGSVILQINRADVRSIDEARSYIREGRNLFYHYFRGSFQFTTIMLD